MVVMAVMADPLTAAGRVPEPVHRDFQAWVAAEQGRIFLLCLRMLGDRDEAGSAAQDAFLKAYRALEGGRTDVEDPARWLTRIAVNSCVDRLRSRSWKFWQRRSAGRDEEMILSMAASASPDAERRMLSIEIRRRLAKSIERLSARQRAVFTLKHYEDHTLEEIAAILQVDLGTVKSHMARAVARLRRELLDLYDAR